MVDFREDDIIPSECSMYSTKSPRIPRVDGLRVSAAILNIPSGSVSLNLDALLKS